MADPAKSIPPSEIIPTEDHRIACDGGGGALGHPKVFLEMGQDDFVECPYCDRRFVRAGSSEDPNA